MKTLRCDRFLEIFKISSKALSNLDIYMLRNAHLARRHRGDEAKKQNFYHPLY